MQRGHSPGTVREFKSCRGKVRVNVFLHVVSYREYYVLDTKYARKQFFTR